MKKLLLILLCMPLLFTTCKKENKITESLVEACEPDEQVYLELVQPIIQSNCIACHNDNSGRSAILSSFNGVIDALGLVPSSKSLKERIIDQSMPPYGSPPLSVSEINIIQKWADCE